MSAEIATDRVLLDSITTPLGGNESYAGDVLDITRYVRLTGIVFADQGCTVYIEQSGDGSNWDYVDEFAVEANIGRGFSIEAITPYARLRVVNGSVGQKVLRCYLYGCNERWSYLR